MLLTVRGGKAELKSSCGFLTEERRASLFGSGEKKRDYSVEFNRHNEQYQETRYIQ